MEVFPSIRSLFFRFCCHFRLLSCLLGALISASLNTISPRIDIGFIPGVGAVNKITGYYFLNQDGTKAQLYIGEPTSDDTAATKKYVDDAVAGVLPPGGTTGQSLVKASDAGGDVKWADKQDKLTGAAGQVVGFDASGNAVAQKGVSETELKIMNGDLILTKQGEYGLTGLAYAEGKFVAVYNYGFAYSADDGKTWSSGNWPSGPIGQYNCITCGNGKFIASGSGHLNYSIDGITWWYDQYSDLLNPNAAAYGQDGFVLASDHNGTLHYKSDTKITMNQVNAAIQLAIKNLGLSS